MLKFRLRGREGRHVLVLGLEKGNIDNLKRSLPILVQGEELGVSKLDILVLYGDTQADIKRYVEHELKMAGLPKVDQPPPPPLRPLFDRMLELAREGAELKGQSAEHVQRLVEQLEDEFARAVAK